MFTYRAVVVYEMQFDSRFLRSNHLPANTMIINTSHLLSILTNIHSTTVSVLDQYCDDFPDDVCPSGTLPVHSKQMEETGPSSAFQHCEIRFGGKNNFRLSIISHHITFLYLSTIISLSMTSSYLILSPPSTHRSSLSL
jgi:hypothetical protein